MKPMLARCDMISFNLWLLSVLIAAGLGAFIGVVITLKVVV